MRMTHDQPQAVTFELRYPNISWQKLYSNIRKKFEFGNNAEHKFTKKYLVDTYTHC